MERFKRAKLVRDAIPCYTSKITPKSSLQPPTSTINQFTPPSRKSSQFYPPSSSSSSTFNRFSLPSKLDKNHAQFLGTGCKRYYYGDRYHQVHHLKLRGPNRWFQNCRHVLLVVVFVASGVSIILYLGHLEKVPYTKRTHFLVLSKSEEKRRGELNFNGMKNKVEGKILPEIHPESVRVSLIAKQIIEGLQKKENVWTDHMSYSGFGNGGESLKAVMLKFLETRERGSKAETCHLDGFNWEVLVVNEPTVNAFCVSGGKIMVFTGLLDHLKTDAEIATIIAHGVGHVVARHYSELVTENAWLGLLNIVLYLFVAPAPEIIETMSHMLLRLPFSQRLEIEADYIGLLLMASAGYDPRVAPQAYEKLADVTSAGLLRDHFSDHPCGKKRAKLLAQAKVMEEALAIYREMLSGKRD